jgi:sugar porter (SP) family MFS transporter
MAIAPSYGVLMFGRIFVGIGVGTGLAIDPLYIAEVTPAKHRGELVTWSEIMLNAGIVLGFAMSLFLAPLDDALQWRVMFLLGCVLPSVMIYLVLYVMPESPRWLVANGQDEEARRVLQLIYPEGFNVDLIIEDVKEALEREAAAEQAVGWAVLFRPTPAIRRMLMVGVGVSIAQQAVGIDAIQYYLVDIIKESGIASATKETLVLIGLGCVKLVFIIVGGKLFDVKGRRPLFFASLVGMTCALLLVSLSFFVNSDKSTGFTIFGIALYLAFFSIGMGPGAWLIASETFATCIRAKAMSIATMANRATACLMSSTFLSTANAMGWSGFFLMLAIICVIVLVYLYLYMAETKGRSLEDMSMYFAELTGDKSILEAEAKIKGNRTVEMTSTAPAKPREDTEEESAPEVS